MDRYYGHDIVYPPIRESTDELGTVYIAELRRYGPVQVRFLDPQPPEEAQSQVRELLRRGLREGRYFTSDFYPQAAMEHTYFYPEEEEEEDYDDDYDDDDDVDVDVDGHGMEEAYGQQQCFGGVPASGQAILSLPETSAKEGECSVCLDNFEAGAGSIKLRMMPCSHSFHEQCIFHWLSVSHVCPLCRFPLRRCLPRSSSRRRMTQQCQGT